MGRTELSWAASDATKYRSRLSSGSNSGLPENAVTCNIPAAETWAVHRLRLQDSPEILSIVVQTGVTTVSMDQRDAPSLISGLCRCAQHFTYFTLGSEETRREKKKLILNWLWLNIKFELISSKKLVIILTLKWQNYFKGHPYQVGFCPFLVLPYEKKWQFQS